MIKVTYERKGVVWFTASEVPESMMADQRHEAGTGSRELTYPNYKHKALPGKRML